jgi:acyl-CoA thioester hydrolase
LSDRIAGDESGKRLVSSYACRIFRIMTATGNLHNGNGVRAMSHVRKQATSGSFDHPILVADADIDTNGHVNNVVFLRWVQEAAVAHWFSVAEREYTRDIAWVVVRHEIDYKKPALPGDALIARTRVEEITAATTERFCEILRKESGELLARSRTIWCAIDPRTGRPRRIDPRVRSYFFGTPTTPSAPV